MKINLSVNLPRKTGFKEKSSISLLQNRRFGSEGRFERVLKKQEMKENIKELFAIHF
jgi:hypothetical protein